MTAGRKAVIRWVTAGAGAVVVATAVIGLLHLPAAHSLLAKLGAAGGDVPGCPVGKEISPVMADEVRHGVGVQLEEIDPTVNVAPARVAFGFRLGEATYDQVLAWTKQKALSCTSSRQDTLLVCKGVAGAAIGHPEVAPLTELVLGFSAHQRLVNVTSTRRGLDPESAAKTVTQVRTELEHQLGKPSKSGGEASAQYLGSGKLATVAYEFNFKDYRAGLSATNMNSGVYVSEHYMSTVD
jgi:hypothetical protein